MAARRDNRRTKALHPHTNNKGRSLSMSILRCSGQFQVQLIGREPTLAICAIVLATSLLVLGVQVKPQALIKSKQSLSKTTLSNPRFLAKETASRRAIASAVRLEKALFLEGGRQIDPAAHTLKSHGAILARNHIRDWLILVLLIVIEVVLYVIHPFRRFVGRDMMEDLKYPMKDNTVPVWAVPLYAVLLPMAVFLFFYVRRRDVYDLHHSVLGLLFAVLITGVLTDSIKNGVGRPRPDFFWRCFPDGVQVYDKWGGVVCHGKASDIKEGHKSFPSGHTSWSFAGLGFLSLYLCGKIKVFDRKGHVAKLCIVFFPLLVASLVGISRVDDYWHHWQDVFAGGLLGLVVATFCYTQFFPPPYSDDGWGPYAYFQAMEESRANANLNRDSPVVQAMDDRVMNQIPRRTGDAFIPFTYRSPTLEAMELGQK